LQALEQKLTEQITANQAKDQTIEQLQTNFTNSQNTLKETQEQLNQSRLKITTLETQILNHEQLKTHYEKENQTKQTKITELEQNLANTLKSLSDLQSQNKTLTNENKILKEQSEDLKQRILALEADKSDLIHQLTQAKQKYHNHLNQEKSHLTQEIQLIKEVIHV
jgi:chromosome segregation ATPase